MSSNYEVWLNARHPKTLESVAAVRVFAHDDRLKAEAVLESGAKEFGCVVQVMRTLQPGALVSAEMRLPDASYKGALQKAIEMGGNMLALDEARDARRAQKQAMYEEACRTERRTGTSMMHAAPYGGVAK